LNGIASQMDPSTSSKSRNWVEKQAGVRKAKLNKN
jgi:hypothetical protein